MTVESAIEDVHSLLEDSGLEAQRNVTFDWLTNRAPVEDGFHPPPRVTYRLTALHARLGGDWSRLQAKRRRPLSFDFLVNDDVLIQVDKLQHFSSARLESLEFYDSLEHSLDIRQYREVCTEFHDAADRYQRTRQASDFPLKGGRTAQRAYFDAVRDLLAPAHGYRVIRLPAASDELTEQMALTLRILL